MVSTALFTGLSGLRLHQSYIDVIGNNLANVSTAGFRGGRPTFSDLLSTTLRAGSGPNGNLGGLNPVQVGNGAIMTTVDIDTSQGTFQDTGRPLDVALQGRGFFTLTDGLQRFYTRVGTFSIDNERALVDVRTGLRVMAADGGTINVPVADTLPARATTSVSFQGNLPARVGGPFEEIVQSSAVLQAGLAAAKTAQGTAGTGTQFNLSAFAGKSVLVSVNGGAQQSVTFPSTTFGAGPVNASTVAAAFTVAGLSVTADDVNGTIDFDTIQLGSNATLKFDNGPGASGLLGALGLDATLVSGSQSTAIGTTDLGALTARRSAYQTGDQIVISGTNPDRTSYSDTFIYGTGPGTDGTTLQDLVTFINSTVDNTQSTASLTADGHIRLTANSKGDADLSLSIGDSINNTGKNNWPNFTVSQQGTGADTAITSIEIIDAQGLGHTVTMTYTRSDTDPTVWGMAATMDPSEGTITQGSINQIRFNDNGSFNVIGGGSNTLQFSFTGISAAQTVAVDLGTSGQFDGIAMLGNQSTIAATDQDGFESGTLLNAAFDTNGSLVAFYTNGQSKTLEQLRVTLFANEAGLLRVGDTMFVESPNSDSPIFTTANTAGAGTVRAGSLENSNVDIAREFVNLIEAQRGFQASSRVITTADEILAELMNIVR